MLTKVMVVEGSSEVRAQLVDALCELPRVEVHSIAGDLAAALRSLVIDRPDVIVATDTPRTCLPALLAVARECKLEDVVVYAPDASARAPHWLETGASHVVVGSLDDLAAAVADLAHERELVRQRTSLERPAPIPTEASRPVVGLDPVAERIPARVGEVAMRMIAKARSTSPTPEVVDLAEVLREAFRAFRRAIPDDVEVIVETAAGTPRVRCVPREIERLALHVVLAACGAMPWGGKVWLIIEPEGVEQVRIVVIDTGSGVRVATPKGVWTAADHQDPTDRAALREVKTLVERHGGSLKLARAEDGRSNLEIRFPAA